MRALARTLRESPALLVGTIMLSLLVAVAVLAPWIAPWDPRDKDATPLAPSSSAHLLGTNDAGYDVLSRLLWGSRTALLVAMSGTALVMAIALAVGLTAGLRGGFVDTVLMRVTDVFLALPVIPLLIFISALATPSLTLSVLLIGLFSWPDTARIVRSQTLSLRTRGFVRSARGFGAGPLYVMRRHLVPALGPVLVVTAVQVAGLVIGMEAGLAFLGLGDPSAVSWGAELERALDHNSILIGTLWQRWLLPTVLAIAFTLLSFLLIGLGLEPRFNPRARNAPATRRPKLGRWRKPHPAH